MSDCAQREDRDGFTAWLRSRSDTELAGLFGARPDLVTPAPAGIDALASRATKRLSLHRALDDLDRFALHVIVTLAALPAPVQGAQLEEILAAPPNALRRCIATLHAHALAWGSGEVIRPAPGLKDVLGEAALNGDCAPVAPEPPPLHGILNGSREVDQAAADSVLRAIKAAEGMLTRWGTEPAPVLKSGGLGIRELRKVAASLDVDLRAAALYAEVARAAGLLTASGWAGGEWLPSRAFDGWRDATPACRWAALVRAWLAMTRLPALIGVRDDQGRPRSALGGGLDRVDAPRVRSWVLSQLATVMPGESVTVEAALRRLAWRWPRGDQPLQNMLAETAIAEAALLGLTGLGALSAHGRALIRDGDAAAAAVLAGILPDPVSHVLLQSDLTAVAPGPVTAGLDRELALAADVESTGGATVYRFSANSVRRALDAGRSAEGLLEFLQRCSRTSVPQPLRYLIEDMGRLHGQVRVGTAAAYVRCDDPAVLAEIAADRRAAGLRPRLLAPTVLISSAPRSEVLAVLRQLGYVPAAESADGTLEIATTSHRAEDRCGRFRPQRRASTPMRPPWPAEQRALAAVRVLRSADA